MWQNLKMLPGESSGKDPDIHCIVLSTFPKPKVEVKQINEKD